MFTKIPQFPLALLKILAGNKRGKWCETSQLTDPK